MLLSVTQGCPLGRIPCTENGTVFVKNIRTADAYFLVPYCKRKLMVIEEGEGEQQIPVRRLE